MSERRRVLVVGGGITGLTAALELSEDPTIGVELRERSDRLGGKLASSRFAGVDGIDEGADAYLVRVPHAVELAEQVGLTTDDLTSPTAASASVWHDGLYPIPGGVVLGVPASIMPFATSGLLSWRGKARAALEPFLPRTDADDSIGRLVRSRFGDEVHERLVDALVGSIYATDTDRSSLAAIPQLAQVADRNRSLLLGARAMRRAAPSNTGPIFATPRAGMAGLVRAIGDQLEQHGVTIQVGRCVDQIESDGDRWRVDGDPFDAVILATPARVTAPAVGQIAPEASAGLAAFEHADVIMVRLAVPGSDWPERLGGRSGYLVPKPVQRTVTAASFGSQKWTHWRPDDGRQVLRVSLGRDGLPVRDLDDDAVIAATLEEVGAHIGVDLQPTDLSITRWTEAFPQYRPHHHDLVAALDSTLPPTITLAGASYRGIGIPACVADGRRAATRIRQSLGLDGSSLA